MGMFDKNTDEEGKDITEETSKVNTDEEVNTNTSEETVDDTKITNANKTGKGVVSDIEKKLGKGGRKDKDKGGVRAKKTAPFDLSNMSEDDLRLLKNALAATPDRVTRKKVNPTITLRRIDGRMILDFKRSYNKLIDDPENNRKISRPHIPVLFEGDEREDENYKVLLYNDFINAERVVCEVIRSRNEEYEIEEGETISRRTGRPVMMVVTGIHEWFTVVLPGGEEIEIEGKLANA